MHRDQQAGGIVRRRGDVVVRALIGDDRADKVIEGIRLGLRCRPDALVEQIAGVGTGPTPVVRVIAVQVHTKLIKATCVTEDTTAQRYCAKALTYLEDLLKLEQKYEEAEQFIKAHHLEFIELFQDQAHILRKLIEIDPERADTYRQYIR